MNDKVSGFSALYPVVAVERPARTAAALQQLIPMETVFEADWYVHLKHQGLQIGFVRFDHESVPVADRIPAKGVFVTVDADDVARLWDEKVDLLDVVVPLTDEAWGQRHFIARLPGGVLVDVVQLLTPD